MTKDEALKLALEAGFETHYRKGKIHGFDRDGDYTDELKAFAALVAAAEREACAKAVMGMKGECWAYDHDVIAEEIRARGQA